MSDHPPPLIRSPEVLFEPQPSDSDSSHQARRFFTCDPLEWWSGQSPARSVRKTFRTTKTPRQRTRDCAFHPRTFSLRLKVAASRTSSARPATSITDRTTKAGRPYPLSLQHPCSRFVLILLRKGAPSAKRQFFPNGHWPARACRLRRLAAAQAQGFAPWRNLISGRSSVAPALLNMRQAFTRHAG
jgi:hypothetical protein